MSSSAPYKFSFGAELEIGVKPAILISPFDYSGLEFSRAVGDRFKKAGMNLEGGTDGSLRPSSGFQPVELRTGKLRWKPGCQNFESILCAMYPLSEAGLLETNDSCGLHINISEESITTGVELDDFHTNILMKFPEHEVLELFGRQGNDYCSPYLAKDGSKSTTTIRRAKANEPADDKKYHAVANRGRGRVEFRCLGGLNYHLRWKAISDALKLIRESIVWAYIETKKQHE